MSKTVYIIGGVIVLLLAGWFLTQGFGTATGVDKNVDGSTTYTNKEGSVTVGGNSMPSNWPSDAPGNYAGASITFSGTSNPQTGQVGSALSYTVRTSAQAVADHYKKELQAKGWTIQTTANAGAAMVVSATKDTRTFGAWIADSGDGTATITAGIEL